MRRFLVIMIICLVTLVSCDRYLNSPDSDISLPTNIATPINLSISNFSESISLSWELSDTKNISSFNIYLFDSSYSSSSDRSDAIDTFQTTGYSFELTNLVTGKDYTVRVSSILSGGLEGELSLPERFRFSNLSLFINNNNEFTNARNVTVVINSLKPVREMTISEDSLFTDAVSEPFRISTIYQLSQLDGIKNIYVNLLFSDGSRTGNSIKDDIILDSQAEIDSILFFSVDTVLAGDTIFFYLYTKETGGIAAVSFSSVKDLQLYDDGSGVDLLADDAIYSGFYEVPLNSSATNALVTANFQDEAGNKISKVAATTLDIFSQPQSAILSAVTLSTFEISLSWSAETNSDFQAYRIFRSTSSPVTESSTPVVTITSKNSTNYTDTDLTDNSLYFYKLFTYNNSGFSSASNEVSATTNLNSPPGPILLSSALTADFDRILVNWTQNNDDDFSFYILTRDTINPGQLTNDDNAVTIINSFVTTVYEAFIPDTSKTYYFQVFVEDRHGLRTGSNIITVTQ